MSRHGYRRFGTPWAREPRVRHYGGGGSIPTPQPPPEYDFPDFPAIEFPSMEFPAPYDAEGAAAKQRKADEVKALRQIEQKRRGYSSTLITGGEGLIEEPNLRRPSLLGS